jgi:hypothetical protein
MIYRKGSLETEDFFEGLMVYLNTRLVVVKMNREKLSASVKGCSHKLMMIKGYVSPIDVFMEMNILSEANYKDWRFKKISYLERVLQVNLMKCSFIMKEIRSVARENNWKPSKTAYNSWGKGKKLNLQFSKSGNPNIEEQYRTHYIKPSKNSLKGD